MGYNTPSLQACDGYCPEGWKYDTERCIRLLLMIWSQFHLLPPLRSATSFRSAVIWTLWAVAKLRATIAQCCGITANWRLAYTHPFQLING